MSVLPRDATERAAARHAPVHTPIGTRAGADATVRLLAASALWLSLLLVTYWWVADGGIQRPRRLGHRADLASAGSPAWSPRTCCWSRCC